MKCLHPFPVPPSLHRATQFTITCEPEGLRVHLRQDGEPNQDLGLLFPSAAVEQAQQWCNTILGLPASAPFSWTEIGGTRVYYSQVTEVLS